MKGFNRFLGMCLMLSIFSLAVVSCNSSENEENSELNTLIEDEMLLRSNNNTNGGNGINTSNPAVTVFHAKAICEDITDSGNNQEIDEYYKTAAQCWCHLTDFTDACTGVNRRLDVENFCSQRVLHVIPNDDICYQ